MEILRGDSPWRTAVTESARNAQYGRASGREPVGKRLMSAAGPNRTSQRHARLLSLPNLNHARAWSTSGLQNEAIMMRLKVIPFDMEEDEATPARLMSSENACDKLNKFASGLFSFC